ncbi:SDR family NAD(P)-dependent oxidoreductase [Embleya scabrispora]|uniref:SDR family NAD(P)-dependent oxidoreductase n=1 Tax=Embleya scabrispora TaxID=159449 RepID=UPI0003727112|nr:SDR family oxidoreductase [Embleya scabrispora]MYS80230.1 SDR family oxidoreductase [Streptomyces sp. SID5474]
MTRTDDSDVPDYPARLRLDGRGVVVLGAGQGIGRQTAHALAQAGARVFAVDREPDLAKDIAAEVDGIAWAGDAGSRADVTRLWADVHERLGRAHAIVDIIGMSRYADLLSTTDEDWTWHQDIVLRHALLALQLGGAHLAAHGGGAITFVASVSGLTGAPMHAAYGAAKAGLISLVRSAAVELGPAGVRVNAVAPGVVWTPRVSAYLGEAGRAANAANAPLRDVALPADIAGPLLFLTSDLSRYVSGQTLTVDGAVGAKFPYPLPDMDAAPH